MEKLAFSINGVQVRGAGGVPTGGLMVTGSNIIQIFISYLYIAAIFLALFVLIWGGISWVTSGGDKQKLDRARQKIIFAVLGLIVAFLAYVIIGIIGNFFGVDLLGNGSGSGGKKKAFIQKSVFPNLASNWHLTRTNKTGYY